MPSPSLSPQAFHPRHAEPEDSPPIWECPVCLRVYPHPQSEGCLDCPAAPRLRLAVVSRIDPHDLPLGQPAP